MKDGSKTKKTINAEKIRAVIARVLLVAVACAGIVYAAETGTTGNTNDRKWYCEHNQDRLVKAFKLEYHYHEDQEYFHYTHRAP